MSEPCFRWGLYEKALPRTFTWEERLAASARAGYQFVEISIDESEERLERLTWPPKKRRELHEAMRAGQASIDTLCLSGHRKYSLGNPSAVLRNRALDIMRRAIDFAAELGIRMVQIAGYDVFYEESTEKTRESYREGILQAAAWAGEACVMLALENVDCALVDSIEKALTFVSAANTPWFQLYPDIGNLCAMRKNMCRELLLGGSHIVGLHLKDTRIGQLRGVPLGGGIVDFDAAFRTLGELRYRGPLVVEMWNEESPDAECAAAAARRVLGDKLARAVASGQGPA